jgi:hypothetical protein
MPSDDDKDVPDAGKIFSEYADKIQANRDIWLFWLEHDFFSLAMRQKH